MTYYYLAADGSTAGPETLEALTALVASGVISLATLVVPAGGEDWTPLARVLRFYYPDETGATAGPVAFSELHRLNQIAALAAETWVMEQGGTEWKALSAVLAAGGVEAISPPVAAPALPRTATGSYRPQASGHTHAVAAADPYAAPRAQGGHRVVVRRHHNPGIGRAPFFLLHLLAVFLGWLVIFLFIMTKTAPHARNPGAMTADFFRLMFEQALVLGLVVNSIVGIASVVLTWYRLRNVGWPGPLAFLNVLPVALLFLSGGGGILFVMLGLVCQAVAGLLFILLLIFPPGFSRHRRFDTAAKVNSIIIGLLIAGVVALVLIAPGKAAAQLEKEAEKVRTPSSATEKP
jgi:hypothetical protein